MKIQKRQNLKTLYLSLVWSLYAQQGSKLLSFLLNQTFSLPNRESLKLFYCTYDTGLPTKDDFMLQCKILQTYILYKYILL